MGFVVCCNFVSFFALFVCIRELFLMFAISCQYILSHTLLALLCTHTCFAFASKWWWDSLHQNMCRTTFLPLYVWVWLFYMCVFKFAQTLTIVPRVALNWYTVVVLMSLSLTKLSMENKCGIYVLQNINKNSQVVPKIFFLYFWFYFRWLQVCVCVCVLLVFKICSASYAFWSVYWLSWPNTLVMQVVRVSTTDFGVMHIFNCAKLCQNMFQLRRTIKDFGKWAQIRV